MGGPSAASRRPRAITAIIILLLPHLPGIFYLFPAYAFTDAELGVRIFAAGVALVTLLTLAGLWLNNPWATWATLTVVSFKCTIDLFSWTQAQFRILAPLSILLLAAVAVLVFRVGALPLQRVSFYQRLLFGLVLAFAAWVAFWGLLFPAQIGVVLPLKVPPLHARLLGAMYLSGSVFMLLGMLAKDWHEIRVVTAVLFVWTGTLGLVSVLNLSAFYWSHGPTWFWFVAYIGFPLIALWIAWCQRGETRHPAGRVVSNTLRGYLYSQGAVATALALCLLAAPRAMTTVWPWAIAPVVAHIYGAPFLAYGLGALYAARQRTWSEVRIVVIGTLVFALSVLIASLLHANLFGLGTASAWLWFGGFGMASLLLLLFSAFPALRSQASA